MRPERRPISRKEGRIKNDPNKGTVTGTELEAICPGGSRHSLGMRFPTAGRGSLQGTEGATLGMLHAAPAESPPSSNRVPVSPKATSSGAYLQLSDKKNKTQNKRNKTKTTSQK